MAIAWPVILQHGDVTLRPLRTSDAARWRQLRIENHAWLNEWEATAPMPTTDPAPTFRQSTKRMLREARRGNALPFVVEYQGEFVGQINVGDIVYGSLRGCHVGYWIAQSVSGRGIMTTALALVVDHLIDDRKLHRIEIAIRPENEPSNRLVTRLGFRFEGTRHAFLHINNAWRDHKVYVMLAEERTGRLIDRAPAVR